MKLRDPRARIQDDPLRSRLLADFICHTQHELSEKTGAPVMDCWVDKDPKFVVRGQNGACVVCGNQQGQV